MGLAARLSQCNLFLTFAKTLLVGIARLACTLVAGHAVFVFGAVAIFGHQRATACKTQQMRAFF